MVSNSPYTSPSPTEVEPEVIANFIDSDGEIIARQSATNLPIPSIGETVSFGQLKAPDVESLDTEDANFSFGEDVFEVIDIEYTYTDLELTEEEEPPFSEFVIVSVYVKPVPDSTD